jgi:8-oxo-dGTP diphosphatase
MTRRHTQRVAAHGLLVGEGRVLLVRAAPHSATPGRWYLPGGGIDHGEEPENTVARELLEETGIVVEVGPLLGVYSDVVRKRHENEQSIRVVYLVNAIAGGLRGEDDGTTDAVAWWPAESDDPSWMPFVRAVLRAQAR